ncbi:hypothetical protein IQ243_17540 [Nostocales cyanobacterium LEGE 11386]|nr:hypothetical protein [Nostocales cyanobacterium LEGE 11386]
MVRLNSSINSSSSSKA